MIWSLCMPWLCLGHCWQCPVCIVTSGLVFDCSGFLLSEQACEGPSLGVQQGVVVFHTQCLVDPEWAAARTGASWLGSLQAKGRLTFIFKEPSRSGTKTQEHKQVFFVLRLLFSFLSYIYVYHLQIYSFPYVSVPYILFVIIYKKKDHILKLISF